MQRNREISVWRLNVEVRKFGALDSKAAIPNIRVYWKTPLWQIQHAPCCRRHQMARAKYHMRRSSFSTLWHSPCSINAPGREKVDVWTVSLRNTPAKRLEWVESLHCDLEIRTPDVCRNMPFDTPYLWANAKMPKSYDFSSWARLPHSRLSYVCRGVENFKGGNCAYWCGDLHYS